MGGNDLDTWMTQQVIEMGKNGCLTAVVMMLAGGLWCVAVLMFGALFL